jgi:hypothetical protein
VKSAIIHKNFSKNVYWSNFRYKLPSKNSL